MKHPSDDKHPGGNVSPMDDLTLEHFLPNGCEPADIAAALEVASATRIAMVAACVTIEDCRLTCHAIGDSEGAALLGAAAEKLKARAVTVWNAVGALKALDSGWTVERDKALDARLEAMAGDAEHGGWMLDMAERFLKLALSEVRLSAIDAGATQDAEVANAG